MIAGRGFCGEIRNAIDDGQYLVANCLCSICRKTSAAPFVTWIVVPSASFRYLRGEPKTLESSAEGTRYVCAECGTPLAFRTRRRPDDIDVTTGNLDNPDQFVPTVAVHEESKLTWLTPFLGACSIRLPPREGDEPFFWVRVSMSPAQPRLPGISD